MDTAKAALLAEQLVGQELDGWSIERLVNNGKSAAVFVGKKDGQVAAVKVFDTEIIERYGDSAQLSRIERELELRGHAHENLVSIYGGGYDKDRNLYFIVMEYLDGPNLKEALESILVTQVPDLVSQLAAAALFLEQRGLVHRDIKPENIVVLDSGRRLALLDFGVIRPIKGSDITDPEGIHAFIGTLQYSSPEFLLREEKQDLEGWRALTFYQIGAVLHDLLMKRPIFDQFANPYAKLVNAVQNERPVITNPEAPARLIQLAERCLLKDPETRLKVVGWGDFFGFEQGPRVSARDRVAEKMLTLRAQSEEARSEAARPGPLLRRIRQNVIATLKLAAATARTSMPGLPPLRHAACEDDERCFETIFEPSEDAGIPHGLNIRFCVDVLDARENVISCGGCSYYPNRKSGPPDNSTYQQPWFVGVLDNVSLHSAFEAYFFEAIEWCLQVSPGVDSAFDDVFTPRASE